MKSAQLTVLFAEALAASTVGCAAPAPAPSRPAGTASTPAVVTVPTPSAEEAKPSTAALETAAPAESAPPASSGEAPAPPSTQYVVEASLKAACVNDQRNVLLGLKPRLPFTFAEVKQRFGRGTARAILAAGEPCAQAPDPENCHAALRTTAGDGFGSSCHPMHCDYYVSVTSDRGVEQLTTPESVAAFLGDIDTPDEALLVLFAHGHWALACDGKAPRKIGSSWQVSLNEMVSECPVTTADHVLNVSRSGEVKLVATSNLKKSGACVGRRPAGLVPARVAGRGVAAELAASAHLESASVPAFERLAQELEALGARHLARSARRAALDERRHARVVGGLAARRGASAPAVALRAPRRRSLATIARENAVEGCVRETFGALVGLHQAEHAADLEVRAAMQKIARDEVRHAALAWRVAAWLDHRLTPGARRAVARARRRAVTDLARDLACTADAATRTTLGLPSAEVAARLHASLAASLWSEPRQA